VTSRVGVAFINNFPGSSLGGGEVQLLALLRGALPAGVSPHVIVARGSALERAVGAIDGVDVLPVDFAIRDLRSLATTIAARLEDVEIVQGTGFLTNLIARRVGDRTHSTVVNLVQVAPGASRLDGGRWITGVLRNRLDRSSRGRVTRFVAVSHAVAVGLAATGVDSGLITVIANGVDVDQLRRAASSVRRGAPSAAGPCVGFVGRLERIKGCELFIRAAARLAGDDPTMRFTIAGTGSRESAIRRLANALGVADRVEFLGYVESVPPVLAGLDVLVVPSLSEASSLIAMEALALGVPVIASDVGGLPEVVTHGENGLLVPPGDVEAIASAVTRVVSDREWARALGDAGARRVEERFTVEQMVRGYLGLYRGLVSGGGGLCGSG